VDKNIEYEKLTQDIYQTLINEEGLTINVQHNLRIQGKATKHQIDVYWEYKIAGVNNKVAIECKNYNRQISLGKVREFHSVLTDIGNINGIMVTKKGYQKGAKDFAEEYGIKLIILREPTDEDWKGRIRTIVTTIEALSFDIIEWKLELDLNWIKSNFPIEQLQNFEFKITGMNDKI
jgi:Restriction endonuclease